MESKRDLEGLLVLLDMNFVVIYARGPDKFRLLKDQVVRQTLSDDQLCLLACIRGGGGGGGI